LSRSFLSHPRWTIARRDLSSLSREKTIILALIIQVFIAAFSSFLVVGLTSLYDPGSTGAQEIVVGVTGDHQDKLIAVAAENEDVVPRNYSTEDAAIEGFENGEVNAVISASSTPTDQGTRIEANAFVPAEDLRTTLIVSTLREFLMDLETAERSVRSVYLDFQPVEVPEEEGASPYFGFTYTILIPLLLFLPPFISGSIAVDSITEEIERGTLELLRVSPLSLIDIVDGKAAGMIALAPLQAILWIILMEFNGIRIAHKVWLLLLVAAIATITVMIGLILGLLTRKRRQAQLLYSMLVILLFGMTMVLPEHPATLVAKLAVDSPVGITYTTVIAFTVTGIAMYAVTRQYVHRIDPESL
jgi:ABC-2 type transport system permease protein